MIYNKMRGDYDSVVDPEGDTRASFNRSHAAFYVANMPQSLLFFEM
jgi:hypothetical protein